MLRQLDTIIGFAVVMSVVSLLITIVTQIISSLFGLRGKNLADALEALAHKIDPNIDEQVKGLAKKLADEVLTHCAVSDSSLPVSGKLWPTLWKRASAIRPDELLDMLKQIAGATAVPAGHPATTKEAAAKLLQKLNTPTPQALAAVNAIAGQLPALAAAKGINLIKEYEAATNHALNNLEGWFNAVQDRAKQWFTMHMRIVTIIGAFLVAFGLQLDSFQLLRRVSSDSELRARLVATAPIIEKQAKAVFDAADPSNPSVQTNIIAELNRTHAGLRNYLKVQTNVPLSADAATWISNSLASTPFSNDVQKISGEYAALSEEKSKQQVAEWTHKFGTIQEEFSKSGIDLLPSPYPSLCDCFKSPSHLMGILASVGLLSLGAPFWFNLLKSLTSLRPLLANEIDKTPKTTGN